jgi:imidazolonepropionase-like amidohydrolase
VPISGPLPAELAKRMASEGRYAVTTLAAFEGFFRLLDDPGYVDTPDVADHVDPEVIEACRGADVVSFADTNPFTVYARNQVDVARDNVSALRAAGAPVVLGTDAGNLYVFHGPAVHRELSLLVDAGLSPSEAIDAATVRAADALGRHDIGSVRPGRRADLLVVAGNPAQRIDDISRIELVVRAGRFYDRSDL